MAFTYSNEFSELQDAVKSGNLPRVKTSLTSESLDLEGNFDYDGLLRGAIQMGHTGVVKILINSGVRVSVEVNRSTALHLAAESGHTKIVEFLLPLEEYLGITNHDGHTPLYLAALGRHWGAMLALVEAEKAHYNTKLLCSTTLHMAARNKKPEIVSALLRAGADPNVKDSCGNTPLYLAAGMEDTKAVVILIENGANPHTKSSNGRTPKEILTRRSYLQIVGIFQGSAITQLHLAAFKNETKKIKLLLQQHGDIAGAQDSEDNIPLHIAALHGNIEAVTILLEAKKSSVLARNNFGETPLHLAVKGWHKKKQNLLPIVKILIEAGAPLNAKDNGEVNRKGDTPLHLAVQYAHVEVMKVLLGAAANPNIKNGCGKTARNMLENWKDGKEFKTLLDIATVESQKQAIIQIMRTLTQGFRSRSSPLFNVAAPGNFILAIIAIKAIEGITNTSEEKLLASVTDVVTVPPRLQKKRQPISARQSKQALFQGSQTSQPAFFLEVSPKYTSQNDFSADLSKTQTQSCSH